MRQTIEALIPVIINSLFDRAQRGRIQTRVRKMARSYRRWSVIILAGLLMETQAAGLEAGQALNRDTLHPDPKLSPAEVIRIQVEALAKKDVPYENAGIEIVFRFASPANKSVTGPLERFVELVSNPVYRPMLNHRVAQYGELDVTGDKAVQPVILTARDGKKVGYLFSLSRQKTGRYASCWMTNSVIRFEVGNPRYDSLTI